MPFTTSNTLKIDVIEPLDGSTVTMAGGDTNIGDLDITSNVPQPESLVAWWKLDESDTTTTAVDSAGANDGTTTGTDAGTGWEAGMINNAYHFNGSDNTITFGVIDGIGVSNSDFFSVSLWINLDSLPVNPNNDGVINISNSGSNAFGIVIRNDGEVRAGIQDAGGGVGRGSSTLLTTGRWYHLVYTKDGDRNSTTAHHLYIDGVEENAGANLSATPAEFNVNRLGDVNSQNFDGLMDDVRVWVPTVLTSAEVLRLFNYRDTTYKGLGTAVFNHSLEVRDNAIFLQSLGRYYLEEFFMQRPEVNASVANDTANKNFELSGTGTPSSALSTTGGVTLTPSGSVNDQAIISPHIDSQQSAWNVTSWLTDAELVWECALSSTNVFAVVFWCGLKETSTSTVITDADQLFFRGDANVDGQWQAIYSIGGSDTITDTGVNINVSGNPANPTAFRITITTARLARFYINNVLVVTSTVLTDAQPLIPFIGCENTVGPSRPMTVHYQKLSRILIKP